jgi:hypothetical protein
VERGDSELYNAPLRYGIIAPPPDGTRWDHEVRTKLTSQAYRVE